MLLNGSVSNLRHYKKYKKYWNKYLKYTHKHTHTHTFVFPWFVFVSVYLLVPENIVVSHTCLSILHCTTDSNPSTTLARCTPSCFLSGGEGCSVHTDQSDLKNWHGSDPIFFVWGMGGVLSTQVSLVLKVARVTPSSFCWGGGGGYSVHTGQSDLCLGGGGVFCPHR